MASTTLTETSGDGRRGQARLRARGEAIGRFVVIERVGSGAMGVVYSAYDPELDRRIAIKILHGTHADGSLPSHGRRRLLREAQALARVAHPNVVAVHDVGEHDGDVFLAMELVQGCTLDKWLEAAPRSRGEIIAVFVEAARGLAAAHAAGIVHRDFKPANAIVGDDPQGARAGRVRVTDFGLALHGGSASGPFASIQSGEHAITDADRTAFASAADVLQQAMTREGAIAGTPAYMAPEQLLGRGCDGRSDQFSFCVALYEALYGERPFRADTLSGLIFATVENRVEPPPPGRTVPPWLRKVLLRGISSRRSDRYASMEELIAALTADPHRARRRAFTAVGALVLAGGFVGVGVAVRPEPAQPCAGAGDRLASVWSDARRDGIAQAFGATAVPFADETWARVDAMLLDWTAGWVAQRVDACEATRVRGEQSDALMDARIHCLDDKLHAVSALLDELDRADATTVEHAVQATEGLPATAVCDDAQAVLARVPVAADPEVAAERDAIRRELERAIAMGDAGRWAEANAALTVLLPRAETLGQNDLLAEVRLELGAALSDDGHWEDAARQTEEAYFLARSIGDEVVTARAATSLVFIHGRRLARHDRGLEWVRHAEVALARAPDPKTEVTLLNSTGSVLLAKDDYAGALARYERALDRAEAELGMGYNLALSINNVGLAQMDLAEYDAAVATFTRAHAAFERVLGPSHPHTAMPLSNLASIHFRRGEYDEAIAVNERVLAIREPALDADHPSVARTLNNLGNALFFAGRTEEALPALERALAAIERRMGGSHPDVATCLANLGLVHRAKGDLEQAETYHRRALAIREAALGPEHHETGMSHVNIAALRRSQHDDDDALAHYQRALAIFEKTLPKDDARIAPALVGSGQTLLSMARPRDAVAPFERALAMLEKDKGDKDDLADARWGLARALQRSGGDAARAKALAELARAGFQGTTRNPEVVGEIDAWLRARG